MREPVPVMTPSDEGEGAGQINGTGANDAAPIVTRVGRQSLVRIDCFDWLRARDPDSIHAVVTDPPYGFVEYEAAHLDKLSSGRGGVWRIPPAFDGHVRSPLPRFTVQTPAELALMSAFFEEWARLVYRVMVPGAHIFIATNPLLSARVYAAIAAAGFETRGEFIRLVTTLRGGDRPKGAHDEFAEVTVMPRSNFEPWGMFRKPISTKTVAANLRQWGTGGLRRIDYDRPFGDVFRCPPATKPERAIVRHPSLKPQRLMRHLVRSSLPLGRGVILDTFAGSGSTLAAAEAMGLTAIGLERNADYVAVAIAAISRLAALRLSDEGRWMESSAEGQGEGEEENEPLALGLV